MVTEELKIQYSRNENVTYQEMNPFLFEWHLGYFIWVNLFLLTRSFAKFNNIWFSKYIHE